MTQIMLREMLYLDVEKVNSLAGQLFEGVPEEIEDRRTESTWPDPMN